MKEDLNIFIACHKEYKVPAKEGYIPLHVGAEGKKDLGFIKDSTNDNISIKNSSFCELTGIYWMWKNTKSKYIGLCHYRRYFFNVGFYHTIDKVIEKDKVLKILNKYDVIVPKKEKLHGINVRDQYAGCHHVKDYDTCREIIQKKYPEYLDSFDEVSNRKYLYCYNMFIMSKKNFDNYCKWLFDILFELERMIDISSYSDYDKRIFGFLSERLFNVWLKKNKLKLKELTIHNIESISIYKKIINSIKKISNK